MDLGIFNYFFPKGDVTLLGDSTFDNRIWVPKGASVEAVLQNKVKNDGLRVDDFAYDGFTTTDVLKGGRIGAVLPGGKAKDAYMKDKAANGKMAYPLQQLETNVKASPKMIHYVAFNAGGNNIRENLLRPWRIPFIIPQIQQEYLQILAKLKSLQEYNVRPILMFQYRTDANSDPYLIYPIFGFLGVVAATVHLTCLALLTLPLLLLIGKVSALMGGIAFFTGAIGLYLSHKIVPLSVTKDIFLGKKIGMVLLGAMMQRFYQPILEQAKKDGIPILDMPNTFHPYRNLYECGIEPNAQGSELIAEGIHHILKNHDFTGKSMMYAKDPNVPLAIYESKETNPSTWRVAYQAIK